MSGARIGDAFGQGMVVVHPAHLWMALATILNLMSACIAPFPVKAIEQNCSGKHHANWSAWQTGRGGSHTGRCRQANVQVLGLDLIGVLIVGIGWVVELNREDASVMVG